MVNSLKAIVLQWLGLYDIVIKLDSLEKDLRLYKAKLEYFASAASGVADIVKKNMCVGDEKTMQDSLARLNYLASCFKKKEW